MFRFGAQAIGTDKDGLPARSGQHFELATPQAGRKPNVRDRKVGRGELRIAINAGRLNRYRKQHDQFVEAGAADRDEKPVGCTRVGERLPAVESRFRKTDAREREREGLIAGFLGLNAVFWYLAIKAIAFLGLLASL